MQLLSLSMSLLCMALSRCASAINVSNDGNTSSITVFQERVDKRITMFRLTFSLFTATLLPRATAEAIHRPVVLMHGIAASASDMDEMASWLRVWFPGIYVLPVEIGDGADDSFFWPLDRQVEQFCATMRNDPQLRQGFNLLGFSQGSLIVRGAVERCSLPVYNLISLSGLQQGIFGVPYLLQLPVHFRELITKYAYETAMQNHLSVANYWRDPMQLSRYTSHCHFLPDINNERDTRNETYRTNMLKLNAFVMTYSDLDDVVTPKESGWFMGYAPQSLNVETWNHSRQFTDDLLGLRTLWEQGRLHTFISHTRHQDTPHAPNREFFMRHILPFFNNTLS